MISNQVLAKMDDLKDVMASNIDKILQRGERLDVIIDKTADLASTATVRISLNLLVIPFSYFGMMQDECREKLFLNIGSYMLSLLLLFWLLLDW